MPDHSAIYAHHAAQYDRLVMRTDYRFESVGEAEQLTRFFFGDEMCSRIQVGAEIIVPECTGIWWSWP